MHSHLGPLPSKRNSWEKSWHPGRWRTCVRIHSCASVLVLTSDIAPSPKSPHRQSYQGVRGRVRKTEMSDRAGEVGSDRKSTRLNSSHLVISYAVFCLKKKKKNTYQAYNTC